MAVDHQRLAGLVLPDPNDRPLKILPCHTHKVLSALPGIERQQQDGEHERLALGTEQRDFLVRPYRDRCDLRFRLFQPRRRIESLVHKIGLVRPAIDAPDHLLDRSEEHTSELQSLMRISYAVFCLKKKTRTT